MGSAILKNKKNIDLEPKRLALKKRFGIASEILKMMADYIKDGDVASMTDLISAYISNCTKYKNQDQFAAAISTTRQTLHRMLTHNEQVSIKVFFAAIEQIHMDSLVE